jgi:protein-L-isoaspartate O-methyltransferase
VFGGPSAKEPWNINIHYDALLESQVPLGARRVPDVGCGDGFLAARLAERASDVTALARMRVRHFLKSRIRRLRYGRVLIAWCVPAG